MPEQGHECRDLYRKAIWRYEIGMKNVAKVAVSIPLETLKSLERARGRLRKTRSAAITEAIEAWLRGGDVAEEDRRYVEGYLRRPEAIGESAAVGRAVIATWEPWD
jgi:transcriptional regulator of met regulon